MISNRYLDNRPFLQLLGSHGLTVHSAEIVFRETPNATYPITGVNQGTKTFTIAGDHATEFPANTFPLVTGSNGAAVGTYSVVSASFTTDHTDIVVAEVIPSATVDGTISGAGIYSGSVTVPGGATITGQHLTEVANFEGVLVGGVFVSGGDAGDATGFLSAFTTGSHGSLPFTTDILVDPTSAGAYVSDPGRAAHLYEATSHIVTFTTSSLTGGTTSSTGEIRVLITYATPYSTDGA